MSTMAAQITGVSLVYSAICSVADQWKYQSSTSLAFMRGIHRSPVDSPHKGPVTRKMFPFDDIIMIPSWNLCAYSVYSRLHFQIRVTNYFLCPTSVDLQIAFESLGDDAFCQNDTYSWMQHFLFEDNIGIAKYRCCYTGGIMIYCFVCTAQIFGDVSHNPACWKRWQTIHNGSCDYLSMSIFRLTHFSKCIRSPKYSRQSSHYHPNLVMKICLVS